MTTPAELREMRPHEVVRKLLSMLDAEKQRADELQKYLRALAEVANETSKRAEALEDSLAAAVIKRQRAEQRADEADAKLTRVVANDLQALTNIVEDQFAIEAKLSEAEAKLESLKCCGNCKWFTNEEYEMCECPNEQSVDPEYVSAYDSCRFTPSRWTKRGEA